jgi:hypothetical protein
MALRPFAFGLRLRDKSRTVAVRRCDGDPTRYVVEDSRDDARTRRREHGSARDAVKDAARIWRSRLN